MKPDRSNYEIWVVDWLDGNLSEQQAEELKVFLTENPDLKDEIDGIALVNLKSGENLFPGKESLKKSSDKLTRQQFEHLCIACLENELGHEQKAELLEMIGNDDSKKREFELTLKLKLKPCLNVEEVRKSVTFGVKQILRSDPTVRFKTVDWVLTGLPESHPQEDLNKTFRPVWNGMRRLPYADEEIADAFASITILYIAGFGGETTIEGQMKKFSECFGDCIRVGFANLDGSDSRGLAARESFRRALRSDIAELVLLKYKESVDDIHELFQIIYNPRLMFEFNEFKRIFAREVIPAQVMLQRSPILFNPAQLMTFGNP